MMHGFCDFSVKALSRSVRCRAERAAVPLRHDKPATLIRHRRQLRSSFVRCALVTQARANAFERMCGTSESRSTSSSEQVGEEVRDAAPSPF